MARQDQPQSNNSNFGAMDDKSKKDISSGAGKPSTQEQQRSSQSGLQSDDVNNSRSRQSGSDTTNR